MSEYRFNPGDKVRINSKKVREHYHPSKSFYQSLGNLDGKIYTIKQRVGSNWTGKICKGDDSYALVPVAWDDSIGVPEGLLIKQPEIEVRI